VSGRLLNVAALADYLDCSRAWARLSLIDGTIPGARKVRGRWLVPQDAVDEWLAAGRPEREVPDGERYEPPPRVMSVTTGEGR
jgi:excisionase family DNA binding protein